MIIASRVENAGGLIFLYRSADQVRREHLQPLMLATSAARLKSIDVRSLGPIWA